MKKGYPVKNKKSLRENLQHILPLMFDEVMQYQKDVMTKPRAKDVLHRMRIEGKPLRYTMEIGEIVFGDKFKKCFSDVKDTVEMMGEIHDADVMVPEIENQLRQLRLFNRTVTVFKERISTKALRYIIHDLRTKRNDMYGDLCGRLNNW